MPYEDPAVCFTLDFNGEIECIFAECSGIASETEVIAHPVLNARGEKVLINVPGHSKVSPFTLKQGLVKDNSNKIDEWRKRVVEGRPDCKLDGSVVLRNSRLEPVKRLNFFGAFPSKVETSTVNAGESKVVEITITIVPEHYEWVPE